MYMYIHVYINGVFCAGVNVFLMFRVQGLEFRVQVLGFRVYVWSILCLFQFALDVFPQVERLAKLLAKGSAPCRAHTLYIHIE